MSDWERQAIEFIVLYPAAVTPEKFLDDEDWKEAFGYASAADTYPGSPVASGGFTREDVLAIIVMEEGQNDGEDWLGVFALKDGRFGALRAWCDFTGWGCQEGGSSNVAESYESLVRYGLSSEERSRLGIPEP